MLLPLACWSREKQRKSIVRGDQTSVRHKLVCRNLTSDSDFEPARLAVRVTRVVGGSFYQYDVSLYTAVLLRDDVVARQNARLLEKFTVPLS